MLAAFSIKLDENAPRKSSIQLPSLVHFSKSDRKGEEIRDRCCECLKKGTNTNLNDAHFLEPRLYLWQNSQKGREFTAFPRKRAPYSQTAMYRLFLDGRGVIFEKTEEDRGTNDSPISNLRRYGTATLGLDQ